MKLLLLLLVQATAWADGGTVRLHKEFGDLVVTVFTSPTPLTVGPADTSVLLQDRDGLAPILDADVEILFTSVETGVKFRVHPTRENASNKTLYAGPAMLSKPGRWEMAVIVERRRKTIGVFGYLDVEKPPSRMISYAGFFAFPPAVIGLFVIRERLIRRRNAK